MTPLSVHHHVNHLSLCSITLLKSSADADASVQLDANNMMAGQTLMFELKLVSIDPVQN